MYIPQDIRDMQEMPIPDYEAWLETQEQDNERDDSLLALIKETKELNDAARNTK